MPGNIRIGRRLLCGFTAVLSGPGVIAAIAIFWLDSQSVRSMLLVALGVALLISLCLAWLLTRSRAHAFSDIGDKSGEFVNRDLFVFVYDMQGNCLAHGRNPEKIGENMLDWQVPDGSFHVRERINIAKTSGKGWQQFKSLNPVTKRVENKVAYVEAYDDLIVSSGAYK